MRGSDLLLHGLDKELRDLGRSKLIPCQGGFGSREDNESNRVCEVVYRKGICPTLASLRCRMGESIPRCAAEKIGSRGVSSSPSSSSMASSSSPSSSSWSSSSSVFSSSPSSSVKSAVACLRAAYGEENGECSSTRRRAFFGRSKEESIAERCLQTSVEANCRGSC
jgi:hypothetical protein